MKAGVELPALGESVVEGTVSRWLVAVGDRVEVDQPLVEVTTDKVDAEIPSPVAGVVVEILAGEGDVVEVGGMLAQIDPSAEAAASSPEMASPPADGGARRVSRESIATPVARRLADESGVSLDDIQGSGSAGRITKKDVLRLAKTGSASAPGAEEARPEPLPEASRGPRRTGGAPSRKAAAYTPIEGDRVIPMSPMRRIIATRPVQMSWWSKEFQ